MKKILVLEDEANIRSFVVINLNRAGYETIEAGTGEEALEQLRLNPDVRVALLETDASLGADIRFVQRNYPFPQKVLTALQ